MTTAPPPNLHERTCWSRPALHARASFARLLWVCKDSVRAGQRGRAIQAEVATGGDADANARVGTGDGATDADASGPKHVFLPPSFFGEVGGGYGRVRCDRDCDCACDCYYAVSVLASFLDDKPRRLSDTSAQYLMVCRWVIESDACSFGDQTASTGGSPPRPRKLSHCLLNHPPRRGCRLKCERLLTLRARPLHRRSFSLCGIGRRPPEVTAAGCRQRRCAAQAGRGQAQGRADDEQDHEEVSAAVGAAGEAVRDHAHSIGGHAAKRPGPPHHGAECEGVVRCGLPHPPRSGPGTAHGGKDGVACPSRRARHNSKQPPWCYTAIASPIPRTAVDTVGSTLIARR